MRVETTGSSQPHYLPDDALVDATDMNRMRPPPATRLLLLAVEAVGRAAAVVLVLLPAPKRPAVASSRFMAVVKPHECVQTMVVGL